MDMDMDMDVDMDMDMDMDKDKDKDTDTDMDTDMDEDMYFCIIEDGSYYKLIDCAYHFVPSCPCRSGVSVVIGLTPARGTHQVGHQPLVTSTSYEPQTTSHGRLRGHYESWSEFGYQALIQSLLHPSLNFQSQPSLMSL